MSLLIVQHIQTHWTKQSRGGSGAQSRSRVPDRFELPPDLLHHTPGLRVIQQNIMVLERNEFEPTIQVASSSHRSGDRVPMCLCEIEVTESGVAVSYHYQTLLGAPGRPAVARPAFTLVDQQWGLITTNGRQTPEWGWSYSRHVIHFGLFLQGSLPGHIRTPPASPHFIHDDQHTLH